MGSGIVRAARPNEAPLAIAVVDGHGQPVYLVRQDGAAGVDVRNAERKALHALGLESDANATDIKAKFKVLVKRHHPDANGGDRSCEDRLREIIQAYNYLKSVGYC